MRPVSAEEMFDIDRKAQEEYGIPQSRLMENAGRAVAESIIADTKDMHTEKIAIFCGKGNNGGDGFVAARYLIQERPDRLVVFTMYEGDMKKGAANDNYIAADKSGVEIEQIEAFLSGGAKKKDFTIAIDAVFGTGFKGELPDKCKTVFQELNKTDLTVYAVDVASGLDATTGCAAEGCLKASKTITFGLPKKGFFCSDGPAFSGEIEVKDIGFPEPLLRSYQ